MKKPTVWLALHCLVLLTGCSGTPTDRPSANLASAVIACAIEGAASGETAANALALQRNIETSLLYTVPASTEGVATCRIQYQPDGVFALEYRFRGGGSLHVTRDARIEYTELDARFRLTAKQAPEAILASAERAAFGPKGCGIDWRQFETRPAEDGRGMSETVFRGEVCNCQARIHRNAVGQVIGLMFRSAC
jgi:hypothetical protein